MSTIGAVGYAKRKPTGATRTVRPVRLLLVVGALSCDPSDTPGPTAPGQFEAPPTTVSWLATGTATIAVPSTNWADLSGLWPYRTLALISISGLAHVEQQGGAYVHDTDYRGLAYGFQGCVEGLRMYTNDGYDPLFGYNGCPTGSGDLGARSQWALYAYVGRGTRIQWQGPYPQSASQYSGTFNVLVTPVEGELRTSASAHTVVRGTSIRFTADVIPRALGGLPLPATLTWRYVTSSGQTYTPCGGVPICDYPPLTSGTMYQYASVNNVAKTRSEAITVLDSMPPLPVDTGDGGGRRRSRRWRFRRGRRLRRRLGFPPGSHPILCWSQLGFKPSGARGEYDLQCVAEQRSRRPNR